MSDDQGATIGNAIDEKIDALRTEVNQRIDQLQLKVDEMSTRIDATQGQNQGQSQSQGGEATPLAPGQPGQTAP